MRKLAPMGPLLALIAGTLAGCAAVFVAELAAIARIRPAETLREL